jgi:acyl-CoA synthetase (AMP-forming)/AMP-acid ligase II
MQYNIVRTIRGHASRNPTAPAFIYQNQIITYRQFDQYICSAARIFHERGIVPGDVVVLVMNQSPVYSITMVALAAIGAVSVPLNPATTKETRNDIRKRFGVKAVVTDLGDAGLEGVPLIKLDKLTVDTSGADMSFTGHQPAPETPFCIAMSSGTTCRK